MQDFSEVDGLEETVAAEENFELGQESVTARPEAELGQSVKFG